MTDRRHGRVRTAGAAMGDVLDELAALGIRMPDLPAEREDGSPPFRVEPPPDPPASVTREQLESDGYGWPRRALDSAQGADPDRDAISKLSGRGDADGIVVLSGPPGCGKTVAAAWWALRSPRPTRFIRAAEFARSSRYAHEDRQALFAHRRMCLDDLGAEYADAKGSFAVDLDELVDLFYADRRRLVITTNLDAKAFRGRYGARIADRLAECGEWIVVRDRSMRRRR